MISPTAEKDDIDIETEDSILRFQHVANFLFLGHRFHLWHDGRIEPTKITHGKGPINLGV